MANVDGGGGRGGGGQGTPGSSGQGPTYLPVYASLPNTIAAQARPLPILYGTAKVLAYLIEATAPTLRQPIQFSAIGSATYGQVVASDGGAWRCLKTGSIANAPTGQGADPTAWVNTTAYVKNDVRQNGANAYQCTKNGTSAGSGGPSGTGTNIIDGSTSWMYLGPVPFPIVKGADGITWRYIQQLPFPMYNQFFLAALCEGEAQGAVSWFFDKERYATLSATDLGSVFLLKGLDAANQVTSMGDTAGYQHTALIEPTDATPGGGIPTLTQREFPAIAVELQGVMFGVATNDVNPADIVNDLLTHTRRGCSWPSGRVDATTITGAGGASYRTYCDAAGLRLSMYIDTQRPALSILADILNATNSDAIWSQGVLKIVPLGDQPITAPVYGAVNYAPSNTAQYNLTETDFLDPIQIIRGPDVDCFNDFPIEFVDRSLIYQRNTVEDPDQTDVEDRGQIWRAGTVSLPVVFPDGTYPIMLSRIYAQRSLRVRNTYTFRLPPRYLLLEPTDVVTLSDATMGLSLLPVRIVSVREEADFTWTVTAEDYPSGVAASGQYTPQAGDGYKPNLAGSSAGQPSAFGVGALTSPGMDNIWPNPTSEISPPATYAVANDGSNTEFDYRANVGGAAHAGNWVRRLNNLAGGSSLAFSFSVRETQDNIAQLSVWVYVVSGAASVALTFYDASNSSLGGSLIAIVTTGAWTRVPSANALSVRAPSGTIRVTATLSADPTSDVYFDDISFRRYPPAGPVPGFITVTQTGGGTVTPNSAQSDHREIVVLDGSAFTIAAALNPYTGQEFCLKIKNTSGGALGAITWNAVYKMAAWTSPANGNSRSITFKYDGTNWVEVSRTANDVPN